MIIGEFCFFMLYEALQVNTCRGVLFVQDPEYKLFTIAYMRNLLYLDHHLCFGSLVIYDLIHYNI